MDTSVTAAPIPTSRASPGRSPGPSGTGLASLGFGRRTMGSERRILRCTIEPLAKLRERAELSGLSGEFARRPRARPVECFRDESPSRIGRGHASTDLSIKNLGAHSRQSFSVSYGGTGTAHRAAQAGGDGA